MKKFLLISTLIICSLSVSGQDKQTVKIYTGKADVEFAKEIGTKPLSDNERSAFSEFGDKIKNPFLRIIKVVTGESRRMVVFVSALKGVDYDPLANYILTCALNTGLNIESCICVNAESLKTINDNEASADLLGCAFK